jgi:16S rRNA processing protein RimM
MLLVVGEIVRPHGIRGEVVVDVRTDEPAERFAPGSVLITDPGGTVLGGRPPPTAPAEAWQPPPSLTVKAARPHLGRMIVTFEGIHERDLAEALRRVVLCVESADLPPNSDPDEYHDHQLVGLAAVDSAGEALGEVVRIDHAPAADLLVLRRPDGKTALVPFVAAIVPSVDLATGRVVITPPDGLFDL